MSRNRIAFAGELTLPADAVTQTFAFLARRGSGKTYGASKLAEGMLDAGAQVVVLDCVGVWWGLRLAANGRDPGIPIPVFGGERGDLPLLPTSGALVARLLVERGLSAVLDVSMMRKGEQRRFATEFAEELYHGKRGARSPLHLFLEEAQRFVPQRVGADEARMLGAFEDLVKLGRNFGIGVTLVSQRPQAVAKDALSQTECLVVLQTNEAQARKALEEWIVEQGLDVRELVRDLPSLPRGTAWVWSPSWLRKTTKVAIDAKRTFDASATPELGGRATPARRLASVELEEISAAMAATIAEAAAKDPAALRKRLAELEAKLKAAEARAPERVEVRVPVLKDGETDRLESLVLNARAAADALRSVADRISAALTFDRHVVKAPAPAATKRAPVPRAAALRAASDEPGDLPRGAREMLRALARAGDAGLTRSQVATLAGLSVRGGSFSTYLSKLRVRTFIEDDGQTLRCTAEGIANAGDVDAAPSTTAEILALWEPTLPAGARAMLRALVEAYPDPMTRAALGEASGIAVGGGSFSTYLSKLVVNGLAKRIDGSVFASATLFP